MSNTEKMVSVPPYIGQEQLDGSYYAAECTRCGWVGSSGELTNDAQCTRIEGDGMCLGDTDEIGTVRLLGIIQSMSKPAEQTQGEPVALPARRAERPQGDGTRPGTYRESLGWNACLDEIEKLGPLFTRADPGEVERLREENRVLQKQLGERWADIRALEASVEGQSAQLAERDALLTKCRSWIEAARDGVLYPIARDFEGVVGRNAEGLGQETPGLLDAIDAVLSASAEPSAPVDILSIRKDAERYQFLRNNDSGIFPISFQQLNLHDNHGKSTKKFLGPILGCQLDACIDAAISKEGDK